MAFSSQHSAYYSFTQHFYKDNKLCSEVLFVRDLKPPVTGEVVRDFLTDCLHAIKALDEDGRPKLAIWAVTDEGSNLLKALRLMKLEGIITGHHSCFNHK